MHRDSSNTVILRGQEAKAMAFRFFISIARFWSGLLWTIGTLSATIDPIGGTTFLDVRPKQRRQLVAPRSS